MAKNSPNTWGTRDLTRQQVIEERRFPFIILWSRVDLMSGRLRIRSTLGAAAVHNLIACRVAVSVWVAANFGSFLLRECIGDVLKELN